MSEWYSLYRAVHLVETGQPSTSCTSSWWLMDLLLKLKFLVNTWSHLATQSCSARKKNGPGDSHAVGETQLFDRPLSRVSRIFGLGGVTAATACCTWTNTPDSVDVITNRLLCCLFHVCNSERDRNVDHIIKRSEECFVEVLAKLYLGCMFRSTMVPSMKD